MGCLSRKKKQECIIAEYATTPTAVLAEKYGMKETAVKYIAKKHGIKKDFGALREYREAHKPRMLSRRRDEVIQQMIADYPYYSNVHLANKYHMTRRQINNAAKHYHLHKDFDALRKVRKGRQRDILAEYSTRPTYEMAAEMGLKEDTLRRRANRIGIHKTERTSRPREKTFKERTVLIYANDYSINEISASTGIHRSTVQSILKRNGITPQPPKLKKAVTRHIVQQPKHSANNTPPTTFRLALWEWLGTSPPTATAGPSKNFNPKFILCYAGLSHLVKSLKAMMRITHPL